MVASYNLLAIPVVDEENKLVGVITVDDVIDVIKDEATEDIYRLAGVSADERVFTPASESLRKRVSVAARQSRDRVHSRRRVVALFDGTIAAWAALAMFMPIVPGMGGNAATQTLTVIVRGIALGELTWANSRKALLKEVLVGIGNGVATRPRRRRSVAWAWTGHPSLGDPAAPGDDHQSVRGRRGRHADPARAEGAESRSGARLHRVHHDVTDVFGFAVVSRSGDDLHLRTWGRTRDKIT